MKLDNLNLVELNLNQVLSISGGHVPASDWGHFKKGVGKIGSSMYNAVSYLGHEVSDFFRGFYDGL